MVQITIQKSNQIWKGFISNGHAGYRKEGQDIVCAAISVLIINTINSIDTFLPKTKYQIDEAEGYIHFTLTCIPDERTELLLNSMQLGLEEIQKQYNKKYVKLKFEEV